jgi:Flp pilus assembly protein TadD
VNAYQAAIVLDRCHAQAWASLGGLALGAGHITAALEALQVATELEPRHHMALTHLGEAYEFLGRPGDARGAYGDALEVIPGFPKALDGLMRLDATP